MRLMYMMNYLVYLSPNYIANLQTLRCIFLNKCFFHVQIKINTVF